MVLFSLTFVRHGETLYNRKNIIQGQTDIPLSSLGQKQAELVARRLQNDRFTHVFSSDLSRAYKTAKIICDSNRVCRCEVTTDKKLRERKFGSAEGKTSKELHIAAKRAKRRYIDYVPPGAESVQQLQERVQSFFDDVCRMCINLSDYDEETYKPAKIKRRVGGSLGRHSRSSKRLQVSGRSQSFCGSGNNLISEKVFSDDEIENEENDNLCRFGSYSSMQGNVDFVTGCKVIEYPYRECFPSSSDDSNQSSNDLTSNGSTKSYDKSLSESDDLSSSASSFDHVSVDSDSTLSNSASPKFQNLTKHKLESHKSSCETGFLSVNEHCTFSQSQITDSYFCPNVSVSPAHDHRLSISSISSGRNSSFDDTDGLPSSLADILVVSHGGFIKETLRYFVDSLDCKIPGEKSLAMKVCPNCSISRFIVSLDEDTSKSSLTCVTLHDKDHLSGLEISSAKGEY